MFYRSHERRPFSTGDVSMTKQSHKEECDIHRILSQYQRTGILSHIARHQPRFEDLPDPMDYQESLNVLDQAQQAFAALPAAVRAEYRNDPMAFLSAFQDERQLPRLRELGLLKPLAQPAPHPLAQSAVPPAAVPPADAEKGG